MLLVIGADALIGRSILAASHAANIPVVGTSRRPNADWHLELGDPPSRWKLPDSISSGVLCASITGLARCEADPVNSRRINVEGTLAMARALDSRGAPLVFLSSDRVFAPGSRHPSEATPTAPVTEYGRQKAETEHILREEFPNCRIIRLSKVVSRSAPPISAWIESLQVGRQIHAHHNLFLAPLDARIAAREIIKVALGPETGIFHLCGKQALSYYEFVRQTAIDVGADPALVIPTEAPEPNSPDEVMLATARRIE